MAAGTYSVTTNSGVNKIWRKVQGDLQTALQYECEEWEMLDDLKNFDIDWSAREITVPIDINEGAGVASIPEGGDEARPSSPNAEEITLSWITLNKRFTVSKQARWIDEKNREAQIQRQIVFQGMHAVRDLKRDFSDRFYGFSTAILALTDTNISGTTGTLTLKDAYGVAGIDDAAYIAAMFKVGDWIAVLEAGALVTNAIGVITAVTAATPSIAVTFNGSVSVTNNDLQIVKANSLENTTVTGTDYNRGLAGVLEGMTSTTVHSLAESSVARWAPAYSSSTAGRFTGTKLHRAKQEIANKGGGTLNTVLWAQGVERDVVAQERAAVRFGSPMGMEIDGSAKAKGVKFIDSRRVPPGYAFCLDKSSFRKMTLLEKPGQPAWEDGYKLQDKSGYVFGMDYPVALVHLNRQNYAHFSAQTES